jgi:hypothetical protein
MAPRGLPLGVQLASFGGRTSPVGKEFDTIVEGEGGMEEGDTTGKLVADEDDPNGMT